MQLVLQGLLLGFIIVLPGMSGGTVFVILGMYEKMIKDIARLKILPYLPLIGGIVVGIFLGGSLFAFFFETYRNITAAFLMGCLLASIRAVLKNNGNVTILKFAVLLIGLAVGYLTGGEPIELLHTGKDVGWMVLLIGGALSSAAMIIPGIPGSSVLIVMGIYDSVLIYIRELVVLKLLVYGIGSIAGVLILANLLEIIYNRYKSLLSYFFAGLIMGSSRVLMPYIINIPIGITFAIGFVLVWNWSSD